MEYLASLYIDNELNLDEKVQFIDETRKDIHFYEETRSLLLQEKHLRSKPDTSMIPRRAPVAATFSTRFMDLLKPLVYATAGFAVALVLWVATLPEPRNPLLNNRFVLYEPDVRQVELVGSFTGWQRTPMKSVGNSGYWELNLELAPGEHRFAYILDGSRQMADPTLSIREKDDFGGENSILLMEKQI